MKKTPEIFARLLAEAVDGIDDQKKINEIIDRFIDLLCEKNVFHISGRILKRFEKLYDEKKGTVKAELTIRNLKAAQGDKIKEALSRRLKKEVDLSLFEDSKIIGGARLKIGDYVFDNTLINRLNNLKEQMTT